MKSLITLFVVGAVGVAIAQYTPVIQEMPVAGPLTVTTGGSVTATGTGFVASTALVDTNATTTVTGYTPQFVGQILVGGAGTGTNAVWVAIDATTNGWVNVATVAE